MIPEISIAVSKWKIISTMGVGLGVVLADANVQQGGWEDYTLKGGLAVVVVVLWRLLSEQQKTHREDMKALHEYQKTSLDKTVNDCTSTMKDLRNSTEVQTGYFRQVAQTIINSSVLHNSERREDMEDRDRNRKTET